MMWIHSRVGVLLDHRIVQFFFRNSQLRLMAPMFHACMTDYYTKPEHVTFVKKSAPPSCVRGEFLLTS